jgi:hypothetical protein
MRQVRERFSTRCKNGINHLLRPAGLKISTTLVDTTEATRLDHLRERGHWANGRYAVGLGLDRDRCLRFLDTVVAPFGNDFAKLPRGPQANGEYHLHNQWFGPIDAEVLYSIVRHDKPRNIVEIGSGFSTRLIRRAIREGHLETVLTSVDPQPRVPMADAAHEHLLTPVENVPIADLLERLGPRDLLFIDSSHKVETGGDIVYLFLELIPRLPPGVLIHVHDVFLPYEYPVEWVIDQKWGWTEQYLVHSFLCHNSRCEIVWPARYAWTECREEIDRIIPSAADIASPSSLWFRMAG